MRTQKVSRAVILGMALSMLLQPLSLLAQATRVEAPKNKYTLAQDVQLGRQAAAEIERQLPTLPEGSEVDAYVERVGRRLVAALPREFQHAQFQYEFDVVNAREINAFALPGGPIYLHRGMIEAARSEGEMAGVMAHEISHVALRHGTAQASKAQSAKFHLPALGGAILGAIIGGNLGGVITQGTQLGLGVYFLKYSRDYENQADILGAQIMARAGYDPRDLANMFRTIERQGGRGGPEWLSSHPNPDNRYDRIEEEARRLRVDAARGGGHSADFNRAQAALRRMSPAPTLEQIARNQPREPGGRQYPSDSRIERGVERPSARYRTYTGGNLFQIAVPENWREFGDRDSVTFAPRGAYGDYQGQPVFTHGTVVGVVNAQTRDLRQASDRYLNALLQGNSYLEPQSHYRRGRMDGRQALSLTLAGRSPVTGRTEVVIVSTTMLDNGLLFYVINVAPGEEYQAYERVFRNVLGSVEIGG